MACPRLLSDSDLSKFRTKPCRRSRQMGCDFGLTRCQYSHNIYWPRRCPFYLSNETTIRYIPVICPDIEIKEDESSISHCNRGGGCPFAHSFEEINFHPLIYKTKLCEQFQRGDCNTYYCHLIHGLAERREPKIYILPYTKNVNIPHCPGVVIANKSTERGVGGGGKYYSSFKNREGSELSIRSYNEEVSVNQLLNRNEYKMAMRNSDNGVLRAGLDNMFADNRWSDRTFTSSTFSSPINNNHVYEEERTAFWGKNATQSEINNERETSHSKEENVNANIVNVFRALVLDESAIVSKEDLGKNIQGVGAGDHDLSDKESTNDIENINNMNLSSSNATKANIAVGNNCLASEIENGEVITKIIEDRDFNSSIYVTNNENLNRSNFINKQ